MITSRTSGRGFSLNFLLYEKLDSHIGTAAREALGYVKPLLLRPLLTLTNLYAAFWSHI